MYSIFKFAIVALSSLSIVVNGAAVVPRAASDVWSPPILDPNAQTVWPAGSKQNVTWYVFYPVRIVRR